MAVSVLIVDDDERFRDLARRLLGSWGCTADSEAGSVADALQRVAMSRPDVALVDVGLPDGDGFELSRILVADPWRVRVVLTSADDDAATAYTAARAGAAAFIPKSELSDGLLQSILNG